MWGLHSDNGSEFLGAHLIRYCQERGVTYHRSRPYARTTTPTWSRRTGNGCGRWWATTGSIRAAGLAWLNGVYEALDVYANVVLPNLKVIGKSRVGSKVRKRFDTAKTPLERLRELGALLPARARRAREPGEQPQPARVAPHPRSAATPEPSDKTHLAEAAD